MFITKIRVLVATLVATLGFAAVAPTLASAAVSRATCEQWYGWADSDLTYSSRYFAVGRVDLGWTYFNRAVYWSNLADSNGC